MNYEPLIERDLDAIPDAAHEFLDAHTVEELWTSVTRFAVLAYAPSQHSKRAVMACRAAWDVREELGDRFTDMIVACARYAAEARQPWSEPPILEPPEPSSGDLSELREALRDGDRVRAEQWLSARLSDADVALRDLVHGDALLMLDTAAALEPLLGEKGRYALLRMPVWELIADPNAVDEDLPLETLITRAVEENGSVASVREVLIRRSGFSPTSRAEARPTLTPYPLARDYAQTLLVHALIPHPELLHAVHYNLEHGESYADWSFA
ncbi:MAG TPA: hypothetical protein VEO54_11660 [Thermoanaerobaculia bacterium]|nr:hypothetical protein [Thermoanaerobaculia bacterium]